VKTEENPYSAPQVSALTKADPREGALWYVSEGVLHVRDGASLPDVCLSGAAPGERGERKTLAIDWCPAWARHLPSVVFLAFLVWIAFRSEPWDAAETGGIVVMLGAMFLATGAVWRQRKRASLHVFQSDQATRHESRRSWVEGFIVIVIVLGGFEANRMLPESLSTAGIALTIGAPGFILGIVQRGRRVRAAEFKSDWFLLANMHPAAIARLEEIARRQPAPGM
jgi:hypothetical protein